MFRRTKSFSNIQINEVNESDEEEKHDIVNENDLHNKNDTPLRNGTKNQKNKTT